ncbi:MAG: Asd/ArgC dimerization domain-containing protein [Actinomycetaceae bacterium]|nr:Asd/ArgC dimerization domain-containing protein [Actinomycetaceae bacterium]
MTFSAAIIGASGSAGGEIARYLAAHPQVEITQVCAHSQAGSKLRELHPHLPAELDHVLAPIDPAVVADTDVIFVALPHGKSGELTNQLQQLGSNALVIDVGADHRLTDPKAWEKYYGGTHPGAWVYGMPELIHREESQALIEAGGSARAELSRQELRQARTIAVPGCNVTAATLAIQPAIAAAAVDASKITVTAAVGYSGAGKSVQPRLMAIQALSNLVPYSATGKHRHIPEIVQNLKVAGAGETNVSFTPILTPTSRGILAVVNAPLNAADKDLEAIYHACYQNEPLIEVTDQLPQTQPVLGSARAQVWVGTDPQAQMVTAICAIDNLGKGTAAAAVQSMNLALGLPELEGINQIGVAP